METREQEIIRPQLRTFDLTMIVAGLVIGMGIFRVPSEVAQKAGSPTVFFMAWGMGAVVSLLGALTFAEIGSRYPVAGGFYKIFSHCYHPSFAFMVNWIVVISNAAATAGAAIIGADYIAPVLLPAMPHDTAVLVITVTSTVVLYLINLIGIKVSARFLNILMFVKLGMLALLILAVFFVRSPAASAPTIQVSDVSGSPLRAFFLCFIPIFFTYGGYQQTINFGKDIANPQRTMPRAIFYGIGIILFVYLAVNVSYYRILGMDGLSKSNTIAADICGMLFGAVASKLVSVVMFISVMAYVNVSIMSNPRIYFAMAEDNVLPSIFKRFNSKTQVQEFSLTLFCGFILLTLIAIGSFKKILDQVMFFDSLSFITAAASIFILRNRSRKQGEQKGIFKLWGYPFVPALFIAAYCAVNISVFYTNPRAAITGFVLFVLGLPLYYIIRYAISVTKKTHTDGQSAI